MANEKNFDISKKDKNNFLNILSFKNFCNKKNLNINNYKMEKWLSISILIINLKKI